MPVISFISSKGGVGKTTTATLLATQLAQKSKVIIIDADPNKPIKSWFLLNPNLHNIQVISDITQENIIDKIDEASQTVPFVIVDCEGTASLTVAYAIGISDLVIIPTQGSQLDAKEAAKALSLVKNEEKRSKRPILHSILLTRTNPALKPKTLLHIKNEFQSHNIHIFETNLHEREAYKAIFSFGGTLRHLDTSKSSNIEKAIININALTKEILIFLKSI